MNRSLLILISFVEAVTCFKGITYRWTFSIENFRLRTGRPPVVTKNQENTISIGSRLPIDGDALQTLVHGKVVLVPMFEMLSGKKIAIVGVPGCFTVACAKHMATFKELHSEIIKHVDKIICVCTNDVYVMDAWKRSMDYEDILMLADGDAHFASKLGLTMDTGSFGGIRMNRVVMVVNDGVVEYISTEKDGAFNGPTSAEFLLSHFTDVPSA